MTDNIERNCTCDNPDSCCGPSEGSKFASLLGARALMDPKPTSISERIKNRIKESSGKFYCNSNISSYIEDGELDLLVDEVTEKMEGVLRSLVIDIDNDHNTQDTARRVAKMYINEIYSGRYVSAPKVTAFPNESYTGMYVVGPISIRSACAHHFQPIVGNCWVGVLPGEKVIGLSKFNRMIHWIAERPQIQEELTTAIADALTETAETQDIAVFIKAEHGCMTNRGVKEACSDMATAIMRGKFVDDPSLKDEFYRTMQGMKGHI